MTTPSPDRLSVRLLQDPRRLPVQAEDLFATPGTGDLFHTQDWVLRANGTRPGDQFRLYLFENSGDEPVALMPALYSRLYASHPKARVLHFLQPQEQPLRPLTTERGVPAVALAEALMAQLGRDRLGHDVLRISPLDPDAAFTQGLLAALRKSAYWLQLYRHTNDRYVDVAGIAFADYLAQRPRPLRETLELNTRLLIGGGRGQFNLVCDSAQLRDAAAAIRYLEDRRDDPGETEIPGETDAMLGVAARAGELRLGIFYLDEMPVAMQFWVVTQGQARLLKLWEAPDQRVFPIDEVLTQMMALCLIDGDQVGELDFGQISPEFAADWAPLARERIGIAAFNPRTWRGRWGALRHVGAQTLRQLPQTLLRRARRGAHSR
jgi:hypothetical protein